MAVTRNRFIDFFSMTKGLNTVSSGIRLTPEEARDLQDIDFFPIGGWSKRNGYDILNTSAVSSLSCTGLYMARYSTAGGTNMAYLVSGTALWRMSAALGGTWSDITGGLTITTGQNNIWNFATLNDICVLGNGVDTPIQISSSGSASALSAGLPFTSFLFPVETRGYMWYFRPTVAGTIHYDRGYFSSINDPTTVGSNNFVDIAKGQGGDVKGAVEYKTYLYVFKRHGIYQLTYQPTRVNSSGTTFPWTEFPNPVVPGVGTQSHRSIVKFTTPSTHPTPGQELVFFVDQFGIPRIFDGVTTISFASKIGTSRDASILSLSDMDHTRLPYCWSINYPMKNRLLFFLSRSNDRQDTCWVLDYNTGFSISRYKYASAFNVGALFETPDGEFKPFYGDYQGTVYESDSGTDDAGQPINDYYVTGDTFNGSPSLKSKWFFMDARGSQTSNDQGVKISYYADGTDTPVLNDTVTLTDSLTEWGDGPPAMTWGVSSWAKTGLVAKTSEINIEAKSLRVKIESEDKLNDRLIMEGWSLAVEPLGTSQS